jgi:hypothetical protein
VLVAAGCIAFRRYWLEWPSEASCRPDWGQCPIPWLGPMMAPLGLIACVVGTGVEALRGRSYRRWLVAEAALLMVMVVTPLLNHWLSGLRLEDGWCEIPCDLNLRGVARPGSMRHSRIT